MRSTVELRARGQHVTSDRFVLEHHIGVGGTGVVFRGTDNQTGLPAAVKVIPSPSPADMQRFEREVAVLSEVVHAGIVRYFGHGTTPDGDFFLAMEWLDGCDLRHRLASGGMSVGQAIGVALRVGAALAALHDRGVVHRDIKPSNLFLVCGDPDCMRVVDFGIARLTSGDHDITRTGTLVGTPAYIAPELATGGTASPAADVYSLGCVLFECLTGKPPFKADSPVALLLKAVTEPPPRVPSLRLDVPEALDDFVAQMLAKQPGARPQSGGAVASALGKIVSRRVRDDGQPPAWPSETGERQVGQGAAILVSVPSGPVQVEAITLSSADDSPLEALHQELARVGRVERLPDGRLATVVQEGNSAQLAAERAARTALEVKARYPEIRSSVTAIGDAPGGATPFQATVDSAARLIDEGTVPRMAQKKGRPPSGGVHIDDRTAALLEDRLDISGDGRSLWLVARPVAAETASHTWRTETPLVGRAAELQTLEGWFDAVATAQQARLVLVTGQEGVGKSRLSRELARRLAAAHKATVWHARCEAMLAGLAYELITRLVGNVAGLFEVEAPAVRMRKLTVRVERTLQGEAAAKVVRTLAHSLAMMGQAAPPPGTTTEITAPEGTEVDDAEDAIQPAFVR
jgi:serine/threonine protein kinase